MYGRADKLYLSQNKEKTDILVYYQLGGTNINE